MGERIVDQEMNLAGTDPELNEKTCEEIERELLMMKAIQERQECSERPNQQEQPTEETEQQPMEETEQQLVHQPEQQPVQEVQPRPEQQLVQQQQQTIEYQDDILELEKGYDSMRAIRMAAIEYGRRRNFAVSTLRSGERQLVLACKHSGSYRGAKKTVETEADYSVGSAVPSVALVPVPVEGSTKRTRTKVSRKIQCPFQLRAKPIRGQWVIYKLVLEHNHLMAADTNAYAQHRKLDEETQNLIIKLMRTGSTNAMIVKYLSLKGIRNVLRKDIANLRQTLFNPNFNNNKVSATGTLTFSAQQQQEQQLDSLPQQRNDPQPIAPAPAPAAQGEPEIKL